MKKMFRFLSDNGYLLAKIYIETGIIAIETKCRKCGSIQLKQINHSQELIEFRCKSCHQLLGKTRLNPEFTEIQIKCRSTKRLNTLVLYLLHKEAS